MDINLAIIEFIMEKTGAAEAEAKAALDKYNGVVLDAINELLAGRKDSQKTIKCIVCNNSFGLSRRHCPSCGYPAISLTREPLKIRENINNYYNRRTQRYTDGSSYVGECKGALRHGQGTMNYSNGNKYTGNWKNGKRDGYGVITFHNGDNYAGEWKDGKYNGQGRYTWSSGSYQEGHWINGGMNGYGEKHYSNGKTYKGFWKDDKYDGRGVMRYSGGEIYDGEWRDGLKNGQGRFVWSDGDVYEGEFKDDERSGQGVMNHSDGDKYEGEWKADKCNGQGKAHYSNGDIYEGEWKDDQKNGQGRYVWPDGDVYEGEFKDEKRSGRGVMYYSDGEIYEGEWKDDMPNGKGTIKSNGYVRTGNFVNGNKEGVFSVHHLAYANGIYTEVYKDDVLIPAHDRQDKDPENSGKSTEIQSIEELERELFGTTTNYEEAGNTKDSEDKANKKIDKFYTLYRKNEEFQKLLDEEYRKLKEGLNPTHEEY